MLMRIYRHGVQPYGELGERDGRRWLDFHTLHLPRHLRLREFPSLWAGARRRHQDVHQPRRGANLRIGEPGRVSESVRCCFLMRIYLP